MLEQRVSRIQVGDWIQGISKSDFGFHGFVEAISETQGSVLVRVVKSDRLSKIGKVIECHISRLYVMDEELADEQDIYDLIELSLRTRDEAWFMELTTLLLESKSQILASRHLLALDHRSNLRPFTKG